MYREVIFDATEDWCKIWRKTDLCFLEWQEEICQIFVHRLRNTSFMLESKMAEPNQIKNSNQTDRPEAVWKFVFYLVNKWKAN